MRKTYRILADIIAIEVVIQAMVIVFAVAGLFKWIDDGATLDKAVIESWEDDASTWTGAIGHFIHGMNGQFIIPLLGLAPADRVVLREGAAGREVGRDHRRVDRACRSSSASSADESPYIGMSTGSTPSSCSVPR